MFFNHVEEAREELREQVFDALKENEAKKQEDKTLVKPGIDKEQKTEMEKCGREEMEVNEPSEELLGKLESTPDQLNQTIEEGKGISSSGGLKTADISSVKSELELPKAEEGKPLSGTDVPEEYIVKGVQEKQAEVLISTEEQPKEASKEKPVGNLEKEGITVEVETKSVDTTVDVGCDKSNVPVTTSENEPEKAVFEQVLQQEATAEESPEVMIAAPGVESEIDEKPGQETTVLLPKDCIVNGLSVAGDHTVLESDISAGVTETKDGTGLEVVRAEIVPSQETNLSVEETEAAGDGVETKVAQGATEKSPEDKVMLAANEETEEREEQMKEGEGNMGYERAAVGGVYSGFDSLIMGKVSLPFRIFRLPLDLNRTRTLASFKKGMSKS